MANHPGDWEGPGHLVNGANHANFRQGGAQIGERLEENM